MSRRQGFSLVEILFSALILAIAGVAVLGIFSQSTDTIQATDERRELRFYSTTIFSHLLRQPLHTLWDNYGPEGIGPERKLLGRLALLDENGKIVDPENPETNPLGFPQSFLDDLRRNNLDALVSFHFFTRDELGIEEIEKEDGSRMLSKPRRGILHMQGGWAEVTLVDLERDEPLVRWRQTIMCPAVVGRPGLKLSACPAIDPRIRCVYQPLLAEAEGFEWTEQDLAECQENSSQT